VQGRGASATVRPVCYGAGAEQGNKVRWVRGVNNFLGTVRD
jgi:hypothetical protein